MKEFLFFSALMSMLKTDSRVLTEGPKLINVLASLTCSASWASLQTGRPSRREEQRLKFPPCVVGILPLPGSRVEGASNCP